MGISADIPESCCSDEVIPVAGETTATPKAAANRPAALPMCMIGSWRSVGEFTTVKFYTDQEPMRFSGNGRVLEFRADGTGMERHDSFTLTSSFAGRTLRIVSNGTMEFKWSASDSAVTYIGHTSATITFSYYDHRGLRSTQPFEVKPNLNEVDPYTCNSTQFAEAGANGYSSVWVRTSGPGVYGQ
ncbi:hypothetical protein JOF56_008100 [Kibdelosporangium banguiense]|uniref:DUF1579 domain-containing protein n=1 Tax=Kibdelosporangium banguiense TaxID=1365924 RepID=A0ABS4TTJ8_9PSEU|nr:hypothetical protein [Kibdelosporangium banguiense]MBP2327715.1 hypothetical protein [Kibdelosporangium banguiense]